jgi:hypothetical protein
MEVAWRVDWVITLLLNKKRTLTQTTAKASYSSTEFSNEKIKTAIPFQLTPIAEYITKITKQL